MGAPMPKIFVYKQPEMIITSHAKPIFISKAIQFIVKAIVIDMNKLLVYFENERLSCSKEVSVELEMLGHKATKFLFFSILYDYN